MTGATGIPSSPPFSSAEVEAPAKVNLLLRVLEREPSGYHRIVTLFQSLTLADRVRVELTKRHGIGLVVEGSVDPGPTDDNLARKAAEAFLNAAGVAPGVHIHLSKRVPVGGGLGGGSSDAAATLRALDLLLPGAVAPGRLAEVAASLGSDVSFFLCGSPLALGEGRGERLTPLPPLPAAGVVLALPPIPVSTAWAYGAVDEHRAERASAAVTIDGVDPRRLRDWDSVARAGVNDFEDVVLHAHPVIARARDALAGSEPTLVLLSGSGSSVFALYRDVGAAHRAHGQLVSSEGIRFVLAGTRQNAPEVDLR
jgi:4-diphosphocytidyl-2-C-methyl-D-erythritol kinase